MVEVGAEASNRRDHEGAFALHHAACELVVPAGLVSVGLEPVVHGREDRIRFEQRWRADWGDFEYEVEEIFDLGEQVLLLGHMKGSGASSGVAFGREWADLFTISAGRVVREQVFLGHAEALGAAGLSP